MKLTRRQFNLGAGASLLAAPLLGLLRGSSARAGTAGRAQRLIVFFSPNGSVLQHWRPSGSGTSFSFPAGSILEPLAGRESDLVVIDGLDFHGASNHEGGMAAMLTGGGNVSVDQHVASALGTDTRFPSLELGVQTSAWGGNVQTRMSYRGGAYAPPDDSPTSVYARLFGDVTGDPGEVDAALRKRQSIIDLTKGELDQVKGWVGAEEKRKLDAHLESVRDMERGLQGGPLDCASPTPVMDLPVYDNDSFPSIGKAQMDLLVAAVQCNLTRVASIQWSHTVGPQVFSWLGISEGHHSLSHMDNGNTAGVANFVKAERWFAEQFRYLLDRLAETPDPDGTGSLLDTSLVVWAKEMGDSRAHVCESVPFVLAGRANGAIEPGRYLRFDGDPHNRLLVSICQAMGLPDTTFGNPANGSGALPGLV